MGEGLTTYNLEWVVTSSSEVTEFTVEYREDSSAGEVTLEKLRPATRYVARVAAKNSYGYSSFSKNFDFSTYNDEIEVKKETKEVKVYEKEPQSHPKHEKSVSGSESMHLSFSLGLLFSILLFLNIH